MLPKSFLALVAVLALTALACSFTVDLPNVDLPISELKTGPEQTETIDVPFPDASDPNLVLEFGAGKLNIEPGSSESLVTGTAVYNVQELKPQVVTNDNRVRLTTGALNFRGIPNLKDNFKNEWALQVTTEPIDLRIKAGAYQGQYELGGLSLQNLEISDGAADVDLNFGEPNKIEMDNFRYETGASQVSMTGLANAYFKTMTFKSGAGDYTLDFSGDLQSDMTVNIESGISKVLVIVPEGVAARVVFQGGLSNVDYHGDWRKSGDEYLQEGTGPEITLYVDMGAGSLELSNP